MQQASEAIAANLTTPKASSHRSCCECCATIELEPQSPRWHELDIRCDTCQSAWLSKASSVPSREDALEVVPKTFRKTVRERLPHPEKLDMAMRWGYGPEGLLLYGPTGCGKSRVAWEIAKREISSGRRVKCVDGFELARYPAMFLNDSGKAQKFADELASVEILMLDDVFKAKATERVEELLFAVIDERGQWERPCIVTLNDTGETLTERLSSDRGPALIRRLRDYCQAIKFA